MTAMQYRVRVVQLSGKLLGEVELPETASVADILAAIQHGGTLDPTLKRTLVLEGRALEESELLMDLNLPSPPLVQMQEILQVQHAGACDVLTEPMPAGAICCCG